MAVQGPERVVTRAGTQKDYDYGPWVGPPTHPHTRGSINSLIAKSVPEARWLAVRRNITQRRYRSKVLNKAQIREGIFV